MIHQTAIIDPKAIISKKEIDISESRNIVKQPHNSDINEQVSHLSPTLFKVVELLVI